MVSEPSLEQDVCQWDVYRVEMILVSGDQLVVDQLVSRLLFRQEVSQLEVVQEEVSVVSEMA